MQVKEPVFASALFRGAEEALSVYLSWRDARGVDGVEALCASHPSLASALRAIDSVWDLGRKAASDPFASVRGKLRLRG